MESFDIEERVSQAVQNFNAGYNCAQSVFLAYADIVDVDVELAKRMTVSFGGGIGRMREVCGTVSAMAMLAGFKYPVVDPQDREARTRNYGMIQKMAKLFKGQFGTILCRDLLTAKDRSTNPTPSERTPQYYSKRPCGRYVEFAARTAGQMLKGELE